MYRGTVPIAEQDLQEISESPIPMEGGEVRETMSRSGATVIAIETGTDLETESSSPTVHSGKTRTGDKMIPCEAIVVEEDEAGEEEEAEEVVVIEIGQDRGRGQDRQVGVEAILAEVAEVIHQLTGIADGQVGDEDAVEVEAEAVEMATQEDMGEGARGVEEALMVVMVVMVVRVDGRGRLRGRQSNSTRGICAVKIGNEVGRSL